MFKNIWNDIVNFFEANIWNIILFFATLVLGLIVVKIVLNISRKLMRKTKMEAVTQSFMQAIIKFCLYLVLVLTLLNIIGISMSGVLTAISACILAIGMALQNIIANLANGIVIVTSHLFKKGDFVEAAGVSGSVENINFLFVTILTTDNKKITIPNNSIVNGTVTNYGANPTRRVDFTFSVAYESDVEKVKQIVIDVMKSNGNVILDKEPFCRLKTLNASSLDFFANCWVDSEDYWDTYYYVTENVYNEFKRNNISVPFNQIEVRERKDEVTMPVIGNGLPERVEKVRTQKKHKLDLENADLMAFLHKKKDKKHTDADSDTETA